MERIPAVAIVAPAPPPYGGMSVQAERLHERLKSLGIRTEFIQSNVSFPYFLKFMEKIYGMRTIVRLFLFSFSLFRLRQVTVVHLFGASHFYFFLVVGPSIVMAKLMNRKVILNYRGGEAEKFFARWGFIATPILRKADTIAVPSGFLKEVLKKTTGVNSVILPNVIDIHIFQYRERKILTPRIIVSRQLEPIYNISCALTAFGIIKREFPQAQLLIAGQGSEEGRLKALAEEMCLKDVTFLGPLSHAELSRTYDTCDIMINPTNADNFPNSVLEAFACGIPVVTTNVGGIPYMVTQDETGFLVDAGDHEGIARGVSTLLQNPELAQSLSRNGRRVADWYRWENIRQALLEMYTA